ncbi:glycosyltransferase [Jannaschia sp. R86511]|uniref:glycosyltransferase n=1 Tax=Jannaschia sp. R86511 TaxID=3093853 RepID=UPI0036D43AAF
MRTWIELGASLDPSQWAARHRAGEVPDASPYGLHRLQEHGHAVRFRPPPAGVAELPARVVRRGTGMQWTEAVVGPPPVGTQLCLAWDERAGVPRARLSGRRTPVATGVIWLDEPGSYPARPAAVAALRRCALVWTLAGPQVPALHALGVAPSRVAHLLFGVDTEFFVAQDAAAADPDLLVSVGNDRHRDWSTLLAGFAEARRRRPGLRLEVVTRAALPPAPGVTTHRSLGHADLRQLYARASCVVLTTLPNGHVSGMTAALEAQASARPVVLSATPGSEDYVDHGTTGWLVRPLESATLADRLLHALEPGAVAAVGVAGRARATDLHSTAAMAQRLHGLIAERC